MQNAIITQTQNQNEKASPTTNPRQQTVAIQTAKVNDTNKNPRLQRDFLSTAQGKMRNPGIIMLQIQSYTGKKGLQDFHTIFVSYENHVKIR